MTEIEIPPPTPSGDPPPPAPAGPESPYKNQQLPLVVVPALIAMVLVLIWGFFSGLTGSESTPRENLELLLHGGFNERQQAAFNLVRQVLEEKHRQEAGQASEWDIDASFLPELRAAREAVGEWESPEDIPIPMVLSSLLAQLGDPDGVRQLEELTRLGESLDPEGQYRVYAAWTLGAIGRELEEEPRLEAARTLIELLEHPDEGLVLVATAGLQNLPSPGTLEALRGMLASRSLDQRGTAALSLAALRDDAGQAVLREMLRMESYDAERGDSPYRWPPKRVSESRSKALEALKELDLAPPREDLERLAEEDPDANVRALARKLLAGV